MRAPIGIQIRRRRTSLKLSQAELARAIGISPSYLNLIENNKRVVGGRLLLRIAERLNLDIECLSGDAEQRTIQAIQELLADPVLTGIELDSASIRDLVARYPEAAIAMTRLHRAYIDSSISMEAYASRLKSDPLLSDMLHQVLNRIAGIRSSAEILSSVPELTEAERERFLGTINGEARDLTGVLKQLVSHFDQSASWHKAISPLRELEDAIIAANNNFPILEWVALELRNEISRKIVLPEGDIATALKRRFGIACHIRQEIAGRYAYDIGTKTLYFRLSTAAPTRRFQMCRVYAEHAAQDILEKEVRRLGLRSEEAVRLARGAMSSYVAGAMLMPYDSLLRDAEERQYDIDVLCHIYEASFEQVAHRLVTLRRKGNEGLPFGFLRADASGRLTKRFPLPGLTLPTVGHGCPRWPIYTAPGTGQVVRQIAEFPNGSRYLLIAKMVEKQVSAYQEQPVRFTIMLACDVLHADRAIYGQGLNLHHPRNRVLVGPSCPLCPREDCDHRQKATRPLAV